MKLIAIGDIHGRTDWKQIISNIEFDKVIFVGDYFDTHEDISPEQQKSNFEDLVEYKKANMDKVVLLFGNHDYHYLRIINETYSGFQPLHKIDISEMLDKALNDNLMQMCLIHDNYIFTHAGITKTWLKNTGYTGKESLDLFINDLFKYKPLAFRFTSGINNSPYGDDIEQSPIWVRPRSLYADCLDDFIQVVGHTIQKQLISINNKIVLIDTIGTSGQFLCITDGKISVSEPYHKNL